VLSPGGLRHPDEPVRHKMLDAMGDLAVAGAPILGRYTGYRAGHTLTGRLVRALLADPANYDRVPVDAPTALRCPGSASAMPICHAAPDPCDTANRAKAFCVSDFSVLPDHGTRSKAPDNGLARGWTWPGRIRKMTGTGAEGRRVTRFGRGALMASALVLLAACGGPGPTEPLDGFTAEEIYPPRRVRAGDQPRAEPSLRYFREVERIYPYHRLGAPGDHHAGLCPAPRPRLRRGARHRQRFLDQYPGDPDAAWAAYILALTYYDQIEDVGRDQGLTFQALASAPRDRGIPEHRIRPLGGAEIRPGLRPSGRQGDGDRPLLPAPRQLQSPRSTASASWSRISRPPPTRPRRCTGWSNPTSRSACAEAQTAGAILGHNFRANPFYEDSFRLLTRAGAGPEARGESWLQQIYRQTIRGEWL
jgi:outer membrane protein assembly factor BamD